MTKDEVIYLGSDAGPIVPEVVSGVTAEYRAFVGTDAYEYISYTFGPPKYDNGVRYIRIVWRGMVEFRTDAKTFHFYENGMLIYIANQDETRLIVHLNENEIRDLIDHIEYTYEITEY